MEKPSHSQQKPISGKRLIVSAVIMISLFMVILVVFVTVGIEHILKTQMQVVQVEAAEDGQWFRLAGLPGLPSYLHASTDGSLWVRTRMWGSLSRYQRGEWEVFRADAFGTNRSSPAIQGSGECGRKSLRK